MSELLRRIDHALAMAPDPVRRAELLAQRAAYLARVGPLEEAAQLIQELRQTAQSPGFERLGIWLILCDGILDYYSNMGERAQDRIMRAHRLSSAFRDAQLVPVASAWRTFIEFERGNMDEMAAAAEVAVASSSSTDHDSRARVASTLSYAFTAAGDSIEAQRWFAAAHHHAVLAGDQATIEALIYNKASFDLANLRVAFCVRSLADAEVSANALQIASSKSFHRLIGAQSLVQLIELAAARSMMLAGRYGEAATALQALKDRGPFVSVNRFEDLLFLEIAYCFARTGLREASLGWLQQIRDREMTALHPDDRMFAAKLFVDMARIDSVFGEESAAIERFNSRVTEFESFTSKLIALLGPLRGRQWPTVSDA